MNIHVGILQATTIQFTFHKHYTFNNSIVEGLHQVTYSEGMILFEGKLYTELTFQPREIDNDDFELHDVVIGIGFHWERKEHQRFKGALTIVIDAEHQSLQAINVIDVEEYLISVISSEMSATSSMELLKAHAVISRSWVCAPMLNPPPERCEATETDQIWYERDAHTLFDVCADDHCQRYQGITRASTEAVRKAVEATRGEVLVYDNKLCDARFSKCCGGIAELFENCWAPIHHPYLLGVDDTPNGKVHTQAMNEDEAAQFISSHNPDCFCNTEDKTILRQVLNHYDQETPDFYRWEVKYSPEELTALVKERSGIDFGIITDIVPLERGVSSRITRLKIIGTIGMQTFGKELEIRRLLSSSHLYSSAFIVKRNEQDHFLLQGAGWGHGVGLCQIGAAVMAHRGYSYQTILLHYYRHSQIEKRMID